MKRLIATLTLGLGLTFGAVFAANAAPSTIIIPSRSTVTTPATPSTATSSTATSSIATPSSSGRGRGGSSSSGGSGSSNRRNSSVSTLSSSACTWVKDANGAMWYNATTPDGYYVNNDGVYVAR